MKNKVLKLFMSPLVPVGMFFLINPTFALFDPLPDFIGYLLIIGGIYELTALDGRIEMASKKLRYLAILSALRLVVAFSTFGYDSSTIMMLCFVMAICEAILVVSFISDWFDGFDYLMQRCGAFEALKNQTNTRFITGVFFFARIALGFLPELSAIFELRAYFDIDKSPVWKALASYKPFEIALFALIVLILGIYWYANTLKYIKMLKNDREFVSNAGEKYLVFISNGRSEETKFRIVDGLVVAGFVFMLDFTIDMTPILPSFIATSLMFAACFLMRSYAPVKKLIVPAATATVLQIAYEYCAAVIVDLNVFSMSDVPVSTTVTLVLLGAAYAGASVLFVHKVEETLAEGRLRTTELSPLAGWRKLNVAYYIFIGAYLLTHILPVIGGWLLWVKLFSEFTFVIGAIVCWNKSIKIDE